MADMRKRLDQSLVERGLVSTRARAQEAIRAGHVRIGGRAITKASALVSNEDEVALDAAAHAYVSRAALKLAHGLDRFGISPKDKRCLDIGASTGGFTQVLLERNAAHITAIDVGHGQLVPEIANDPRVTSIEGLNAKDLTDAHLAAPVDLIVCDVSFISLMKALPTALSLAPPGAELVALIKPQFEAGKGNISKGGIVRDPALHEKICADISAWLSAQPGWKVIGIVESPIEGGDGNREFLIGARRDG